MGSEGAEVLMEPCAQPSPAVTTITRTALFRDALGAELRGDLDYAEQGYRKLIERFPGDVEALTHLAVVMGKQDREADALPIARLAASLSPRDASAIGVYGVVMSRLGRWEEARSYLDRALEIGPGGHSFLWNRAIVNLTLGRWEQGWKDYRWGVPLHLRPVRSMDVPEWVGQRLGPNQTLLLWGEQGQGDHIMACRFAAWAKEKSGARVIVETEGALVRLLSGQVGDEVVARDPSGALPCPADAQCSLLDLPMRMGLTPDTLDGTPYLKAPSVKRWTTPWREEGGRMLVGVAWKGNPEHRSDKIRSLDLERLAPVLEVPNVDFLSLQLGVSAPCFKVPQLPLGDWQDTAEQIAGCDLVISVDTAVAHLAGALGVPVWALVTTPADFRWLLDRADTPWYDSMTIWRQSPAGEWGPVIRCMADALEARAAEGSV